MYRTVFWTLWAGGMIWENCIKTCIISYKKRIASPGSMQDTGSLGLYLFVNLNILLSDFKGSFFHNWKIKILFAFEYVSRWFIEQIHQVVPLDIDMSWPVYSHMCILPPFFFPSFLSSILTCLPSFLPIYLPGEGLFISSLRYIYTSLWLMLKLRIICLLFFL